MANINRHFKKITTKAVIEVNFNNDIIVVETPNLGETYYYACYLLVNGEVVETFKYQKKTVFQFNIEKYGYDNEIKIRYFFQNIDLKERTSKIIELKERRKWDFFLKSEIIKFTSNNNLANLGWELLKKNQLKLGNFNEYCIDFNEDFWESDPFQNRSWQWRLHWFEFVGHLICYHYQYKDDKALDFIKKIIESWLDKYLHKETAFEFIWHDHATALRAEVLLILYCYLHKNCQKWIVHNQEFTQGLIEFISVSKRKLTRDDFYSKNTNHGLEQARVLLLLSIFFDDSASQEISVTRILSELEYSFTTEGVHKENSPGYHQFVLKVFLGIISRFPKEILGELALKFDEIGAKALEFIAYILRPDGNLPIIGDTEQLPATNSYSVYFEKSIEYQLYLYSTSQGNRGISPSVFFKLYPKSGYAIYRNDWSAFDKAAHLIFKAGCSARYHHQQDEGNIVLYAYSEDWLIDSGLYNYINQDPIRKYMRSRSAHNIPVIAGSLYHANFSHRLQNWSLYGEEKKEEYSIEAINTVLQNIKQKRQVEIKKEASIEVFSFDVMDEIIMLDGEYRDITFHWHIPKDKIITLDQGAVRVEGRNARIMTLNFDILPCSVDVYSSQDNIKSLVSKKFGEYEESQLIKVFFKNRNRLKLRTKFTIL